jgi:hypothetical protein
MLRVPDHRRVGRQITTNIASASSLQQGYLNDSGRQADKSTSIYRRSLLRIVSTVAVGDRSAKRQELSLCERGEDSGSPPPCTRTWRALVGLYVPFALAM